MLAMELLDKYPYPKKSVIGRVVDGDAVLVLPQDGQVKVLNEVAARIWELTDGTYSARDIANIVLSEYQVDSSEVISDVVDFLEALHIKGIIEFHDQPLQNLTSESNES